MVKKSNKKELEIMITINFSIFTSWKMYIFYPYPAAAYWHTKANIRIQKSQCFGFDTNPKDTAAMWIHTAVHCTRYKPRLWVCEGLKEFEKQVDYRDAFALNIGRFFSWTATWIIVQNWTIFLIHDTFKTAEIFANSAQN